MGNQKNDGRGEYSFSTNRINMPDVAEQVLAEGNADMVSMARPFLADPELVLKSIEGRPEEINTCIACNQACLDHTFDASFFLYCESSGLS